MHDKNPVIHEKPARLRHLSMEQLQAIDARAQVRYFAAQLLLQAAYMNHPDIFAKPVVEAEPTPAVAESPYIATSADTLEQQGWRDSDYHLAEVASLTEARKRREAADAPSADVAPNDIEGADVARLRIREALGEIAEEGALGVQEAA